MSYCRWSCEDYQCDVYIYDDVHGGITTHVASRRYVFKDPLPPPLELTADNIAEWMERHEKVMRMVEVAELVPIDLEHAGQSFNHETGVEVAALMEELVELGYRVPQYAIDALMRGPDE